MSSVHIALGVGGHLDDNMVYRGSFEQRPFCRGQIDCENARVSKINGHKGS